jgi:hypothetical protein
MSLFYFKAKGGFPLWDTKEPVELLMKHEGKSFWADIGLEKGVRTIPQNSALHLGLGMIAKTLNEAGLDMRKVLKPEIDIPWTLESVKEYLFRPIMKAMYHKKSTTELSKIGEIEEIWDVLMRHLGEKHEVEYIPFPSEQTKNK